jgi:hypothetical protein
VQQADVNTQGPTLNYFQFLDYSSFSTLASNITRKYSPQLIMSSASLFDQILDLEEQTWQALQSDGTALMPFLTKDAIFQFPMGLKVTSRSEPSVQEILHSPAFVPWKTFELSKVDVTFVGPEGAVISYRAVATRASADPKDDGDATFDALCSSVWRLEAGKWMMCFHQQTMTA